MNCELYDLYGEPITSDFIKARKIRWPDHLERLEKDRVIKNITWKILEGTKGQNQKTVEGSRSVEFVNKSNRRLENNGKR